jgi:hypothetical protein
MSTDRVPIAGAQVDIRWSYLHDEEGVAAGHLRGQSDASGVAELGAPSDTGVSVEVQHNGYLPVSRHRVVSPGTCDVTLRRCATVHLRVVDSQGADIDEATWQLFVESATPASDFPGVTQGQYRRRLLESLPVPPEGRWRRLILACAADGKRSTHVSIEEGTLASGELVVVLASPVEVKGQVVDADSGAAVPSGTVVVAGEPGSVADIKAGGFVLQSRALARKDAMLLVQAPGYSETRAVVDLSENVAVGGVQVRMLRGGELRAHLVDADTGKSLSGGKAVVSRLDDDTSARHPQVVTSDHSGDVVFTGVALGNKYCIEFSVPGYQRRRAIVDVPKSQTGIVYVGDVSLMKVCELRGNVIAGSADTDKRWLVRCRVVTEEELIRVSDSDSIAATPFLPAGEQWVETLSQRDGGFVLKSVPRGVRTCVIVDPGSGAVVHETSVRVTVDPTSVRIMLQRSE